MIKQDTFYPIFKLDKNKQLELFEEAKELSDTWYVHKKNESYIRENCEMPWEKIIEIFLKDKRSPDHVTFIHRNSIDSENYLEIGFCTMSEPFDYFLYIILNKRHLNYLLKKYNI
jgi:hypothetical protein